MVIERLGEEKWMDLYFAMERERFLLDRMINESWRRLDMWPCFD